MKSCMLIFLLFIALLSISACSSQDSTNQLSNSNHTSLSDKKVFNKETEANQIFNPLSFETVMTGKIPTSNFSVDSVHKYFQLKIINKSKLLITFNIMNNNNGKVVVVKKLEPHKTLIWNSSIDYPNGLDTGKYTIQYRSNGDNMNGIAYGHLSQNPEGLHK